jgi:hypothetical protein
MKAIEQLRDFLFRRRTVYVRTFLNPMGEEVLRDLAKFCRAHTSTFHPDDRAHALAEGRREVWLRIASHLNLSDDELWRLYGNQPQVIRKPEDNA